MKRHMTSLLERKRVEYGGPGQSDRPRRESAPMAGPSFVQVKDGYDWLHAIKLAGPSRRAG